MKRILLVEDDATLSTNIKEAFYEEGYQVDAVFDGEIAHKVMSRENYHCLILDVNLPGRNGYELCRSFRQHNTHTPVIMLTAFGELEDKVQGFDAGANDYLSKPFYMRELLLRVRSLTKHNMIGGSLKEERTLSVAGISIDLANKKVSREGQEIKLTPREFQILLRLAQAKGELVGKQALVKEIWGRSFDANTNTIEVYVNFLRKKLDKPFGKQTIKTKIGFGYYLDTTS